MKQVRGILNKLTFEKFERLSKQLITLLNESIRGVELLEKIVSIVFEKALIEKSFASLYSRLCTRIRKELPDFRVNKKRQTFKRILLNQCQEEFEARKDDVGSHVTSDKKKKR